ncbi:MAG: hypothetical protein LBD11_03730 [Candidatus Peribacteria bacterium]|jgi:hypothetical protein|nr:hypothetical protein [Candidatus Peribacteria bacterium]
MEKKSDGINEILEKVLDDLGITEERIDAANGLFQKASLQLALAESKKIPHVILITTQQCYELFGDVLLNAGKLSSEEVHNFGIKLFETLNSPVALAAKLRVVSRIKIAGENAGFTAKQAEELAFAWYGSTAKIVETVVKSSQPKVDGNALSTQIANFVNEILSTILDPKVQEDLWKTFQVFCDAIQLFIQGWWDGLTQDYLDRRLRLLHVEYDQLKGVFTSTKALQLISAKFTGV